MKSRKLAVLIAGVLIGFAWYFMPGSVLYQRYPYEDVGPAYVPKISEYNPLHMDPAEASRLIILVFESGILLPFCENGYSTQEDTKSYFNGFKQSPRPHGGLGWYKIFVCLLGTPITAHKVEWSGEHAPETIWPLVQFLDSTRPTGYRSSDAD